MGIDTVQENTRRVTHDYVVGDIVHVEITGIYRKIYYKKQGPYRITEIITNGTVRVQRGKLNESINIRGPVTRFVE